MGGQQKKKEERMTIKSKTIIGLGGVALGLGIGLASYMKIRSIRDLKQQIATIPYPIADWFGQKPEDKYEYK